MAVAVFDRSLQNDGSLLHVSLHKVGCLVRAVALSVSFVRLCVFFDVRHEARDLPDPGAHSHM